MTSGGIGVDVDEYRFNVAALVRVREFRMPEEVYLACQRKDHGSWQCPQGGLEATDISPRSAIVRELEEELGVSRDLVRVIHESRFWRRYSFGKGVRRKDERMKGQQQKWFLCEIPSLESCELSRSHGEFIRLRLVSMREFQALYAGWKAPPFIDFCREIGFLPP